MPVACLILLLSGCASMLNKGRSTMVLQSEPSGATVLVNGNERGRTPFTYSYSPDDGSQVSFEVRQSGYHSAMLTLRPNQASGVLFADAMLLHIPYLFDRRNPDLYRVPVKEHTVQLLKELPADRARYLMPVTGLDLGIAERASLGTLGGKAVRNDRENPLRELQYPEQLTATVADALKRSWMDAMQVRVGTKKGDEALQRAKIHLHPSITGMRAALDGDPRACSGTLAMDVSWRFMAAAPADSVLFQYDRSFTYHALGESATDLVSAALRHGAMQLAAEEGIAERVAANYSSALARSKGAGVELVKPRPIPYNGRKEMLSALLKAVVTVTDDRGHGSGFLISDQGHIITNEHVVGNASLVKVKFEQGFSLDAQVLKTNKDYDLALLKVQATDLAALTCGEDAGLMVGEELFAIGTPLDTKLGQSVTRGILSGRRELDGRSYIQTDVPINPGNSGGPVVDENGKVVGVATLKISGKGLEGLGFAVPIGVAVEMLNITWKP